MKTILLMDIVIVFVGIYLAVSAAKMKKSGQISDLVVPKEEIKKCKDPEAYIRGITPWLYGFAAVARVVVHFRHLFLPSFMRYRIRQLSLLYCIYYTLFLPEFQGLILCTFFHFRILL